MGVWEIFDTSVGPDDYTDDRPLIEYDVLELRDGKIATWTLYYHRDTMPAFTLPVGRPEAEEASSRCVPTVTTGRARS